MGDDLLYDFSGGYVFVFFDFRLERIECGLLIVDVVYPNVNLCIFFNGIKLVGNNYIS